MNRKYRKTIIAGNWKMNMLASQIKPFASAVRPVSNEADYCDVLMCVPFPLIPAAIRSFKDAHISVGAQNMSEHDSGAYTGEVSGAQLKDIGTSYVIIGHSERRTLFGETDELVGKKARAAVDCGLKPIICVGETEVQRDAGVTKEVITLQMRSALAHIPPERMRRVVVAYEPVWAIGTGRTPTPEEAEEVCSLIRAVIRTTFDARTARGTTILYGGSMTEKNAAELLARPNIDGGLISGASLDPEKFCEIIRAANQ